jgi:hypothetical protein
MKRVTLVVGLLAIAAAPAAAQLAGLPVWNSPKGGSGITISLDYGSPNDDAGGGNAFGARGTLGIANLAITAGLSTYTADGAADAATSLGGNATFRVIGGSLLPVAINLQVGGSRTTATGFPDVTGIIAGGGISAAIPTPGVSVEPYLSVTNRWVNSGGGANDSNIGWTLGANVGMGMFGFHVAYDSQKVGTQTAGIIGIGAHVSLKAPIGL